MHPQHTAPDPNTPAAPQAWSRKQVRDALGIHEDTLDRWLSKGIVPSFRLGGRVFIPRAALMELMQPRVPQPARHPVLTAAEAWDADHPSR